MAKELQQTKSAFKVIGKVTRIDKDGAYTEKEQEKGKRQGEVYRSLRFGVKTSETNEITVQMFDYEPTEVFLWNGAKREKDPSYKGEKIPFGTWEEQQDSLREQGFAVLQTRVGLVHKEDGKLDSKGLPSYVAIQEIYNNLNNGDSVIIEGEIRYSTFKNREDKEVEQKTYTIKKIHKIKDVDFEDEKFEEVTYFEQEMVYVGIDVDNREGKAYVTGRIIDYSKKFHDTQMIVNFKDAEGNTDEGMKKLADTLSKKIKFGDVISVYGDTINRVIIEEQKEEDKPKDLFADFGGKSKPKHAENFVSRTYVNEMSIYGVSAWEEGVYEEEDFVKEELVEETKENPFADFGGNGKPNPFDNKGDGEIDEDSLPF